MQTYNKLIEGEYKEETTKNSCKIIKEDRLNRDRNIIGQILIPKLNQCLDIYKEATEENLSKGVGIINVYEYKPLEERKRIIIAGHRGYYNKRLFKNINELLDGDDVYIYLNGEILKYKVFNKDMIGSREKEKLKPIQNKEILTLITCKSSFDSSKRLIVNCKKVK